MNKTMDVMEKTKTHAEKFMQREYPDEAPYFYIAWEIFEEVIQDDKNEDLDLKGPIVRLEGDDTIMAPSVIRAFYILFTELGQRRSENSENLKKEMLQFLSQNKFSSELSMKIVDFIIENKDG